MSKAKKKRHRKDKQRRKQAPAVNKPVAAAAGKKESLAAAACKTAVSVRPAEGWLLGLVLFLAVYMMEILLRLFIYDDPWRVDALLYIALFSLVYSMVIRLLCGFISPRWNYFILVILTAFITILILAQYIYYLFFKMPLMVYSIINGGQIAEFTGSALMMIWTHLPQFLLICAPAVFVLIWARKRCIRLSWKSGAAVLATAAAAYALVVGLILFSGNTAAYNCYFNDNNPARSQILFGSLTELRLDAQRTLFGFSPKDHQVAVDLPISVPESADGEDEEYGYNQLDIDFDALISMETDSELLAMHQYFSAQDASRKNEYTGLFAGKNLIFITAEGFSHYLIGLDLFPTVTRLATEGFEFSNVYTPLWNVSTSDGEYVNLQSLLPKSGVWSMSRSSDNYLPFTLGNQLKAQGYDPVLAYHNHSYTYYNRDSSHPNLGYDFRAPGHGLEITEIWPESDLEMIENSVDQYLPAGDSPFHVYYLTVSGHLEYSFTGNNMAARHYDEVADLPYSDAVKAYIACNLELEYALSYLLEQLEAAGELDDTVIVMLADHYPYGLSLEQLSELAGHDLESNFELYRNGLIIWQADLEHQLISELVCSLDVLPTVSNLFALSYDSRLMMGRDIFADNTMPLVIFDNRSWITDKGSYNAVSGSVSGSIDQNYVETINKLVSAKFNYSAKILERDYYRLLSEYLHPENQSQFNENRADQNNDE